MNADTDAMPELLFVGDREAVHLDARQIRYSADSGQRIRVRRGVYVDATWWRDASSIRRHLLRVQAVALTRPSRTVFGYWSAAAVWSYPSVSRWPDDVHVVVPPGCGAHSRCGVRFHRECLDARDVTRVGELTVTSPARTLVDLARTAPFSDAVIAIDAALADRRSPDDGCVSKVELFDAVSRMRRGAARARRVIEFADGGAANPGESLSRIAMLECGFESPEVQTEHPNPLGGRYFTDFEWPEHRVIGEFDGRGKYLKEEFLDGRTPGEVVYEEKTREDHLRAEGNSVVRWGWHELQQPGRLVALLSDAGVPYRRSTRRGASESLSEWSAPR
ncbi:type IV toxin-antitoxin system AbiEi family antitoxin [Subtercola frigoramans]|uniref:AbiEi antitoxin C-terminal domain-containing protein n=1 Tax=Subtercola frigoramans TaxID=120298 RepID=A0ABS2L2K3_9MICO|nr:type IV toxin-antitoxin system AbiEi family antitoxin [Subtercola frigoramans]MBM7471327.1 hypothetical protein [Subtercola frigoramans]